MLRPFRKPLVVFTPKKLLRYPEAVSSMADLAEGRFQPVIDDPQRAGNSANNVQHVVMCSGKFYYDLLEERKKRVQAGEMDSIALVRLEQLYPFPTAELGAVLTDTKTPSFAGRKKSRPTWARLPTCTVLVPACSSFLPAQNLPVPPQAAPFSMRNVTKPSLTPCSNWDDDLEAHTSIHPTTHMPCPSLK